MSLLRFHQSLSPSHPLFNTATDRRAAPIRATAAAGGGDWTRAYLERRLRWRRRIRTGGGVRAMAEPASAVQKMNLNEYLVNLDKPLGIRFALSIDGKIFVLSLKKGGNAEKSRIIMVGDTLKKASNSSGSKFMEIKDFIEAQNLLKGDGSFSLILERPFTAFPIHNLHVDGDYSLLFNKGRVPFATWNRTLLASNLQPASEGRGNCGFILFSPKFSTSKGWMLLSSDTRSTASDDQAAISTGVHGKRMSEIVGIFSEEEGDHVDWAFGNFPVEEYIKALDRAKGELYYNHSLGMQYSKITEQIYVGSCIQTEKDVQTLSNVLGITAVLNFQSESERVNWGLNSEVINNSCQEHNILMVNYPVREVDTVDLRKKLPFCVGLLLRLLRKNFRIFVTCTTGLDRSPTCVIAYLHWIQDTPLHAAHSFVTRLHSCRPDRPAIVWATWDLIAMVENGRSNGSPTHAVSFVWSNGCREGDEVCVIGDFTNNWKESIKAVHKGGSKFEVELKLRHGKYTYKFIINGQWRHSTALPTEVDERGNTNNVIRVGDVARLRPSSHLQIKDPTVVKVIERPLSETERFMLAFAARRIAFAICPNKLAPKS